MCHPPMYYKTTTRDGRMKRTSLQATCSLAAKCWPTFAKMTDILTRPTFSSLDSCIIISSSSITYISHCQIQATKGPNTEQQKILEFHFGIFVESSGHSVSVIIACVIQCSQLFWKSLYLDFQSGFEKCQSVDQLLKLHENYSNMTSIVHTYLSF